MEQQIQELVEKALAELSYDSCFLTEIKMNGKKVEVYLDSDDTVTFLICRKVSRFMEEVIDEENWLGEKYTLEVSSAGVGRPLKYARQYIKNIGRTLEAKTSEGVHKGVITSADEESVVLEYEVKVKEGKKKVKKIESVSLPYESITEAKIKVVF